MPEDVVDVRLRLVGLNEQKVKETKKNEQLTEHLCSIVEEALRLTNGRITQLQGKLLYHLATRLKKNCAKFCQLLIEEICSCRINTDLQLSAAMEYLLSNCMSEFKREEFERACGIGVSVTPEQIENAVEKVFAAKKNQIKEMRYAFPVNSLIALVKKEVPWADGAAVKKECELQFTLILGPKTAEEVQGASGVKRKPPAVVKKEVHLATKECDNAVTIEELMKKINFHKPGENYKTEGYVMTPNTMRLLEDHLKLTGGKVITRFPPEPNGILHIGHAKAINIDFGYAKANNGICYLRYDDTNPEKEEEKYFVAIKEMVQWLGYRPYKITHSSDYFDQLYNFAVRLIIKGHAYVCHQKAEDIKGFNPPPSPWRDRPAEESLRLFEDMKNGLFEEGAATLRMKVTLEEGKMDPVAYRVKYVAHHRTGDKWCIYPTYDYAHCLCDSIENITHSLCTKEFQSRRSSYYWLCNALDLYCPVQWEFGRLNMNYSVVSKRKILKLVQSKVISEWDDPRLFTLTALRRRGYPPEAVNNFVAKMGLTTALVSVDPMMLEACVRDMLNTTAPRHMVVLEPLKVTMVKMPENVADSIEVPDFPQCPTKKTVHSVRFSPTIYIESTDFQMEGDANFKRMTCRQSIGLKYAGIVLKFSNARKNTDGLVEELLVTAEHLTEENKPKAFVHWVAEPCLCEVRLYENLFMHRHPEDSSEVPGGYLTDVNPNSLTILHSAMIDQSLRSVAKVYDKFQFERLGYFCVDTDSSERRLVFNRTVSLREDVKKRTV